MNKNTVKNIAGVTLFGGFVIFCAWGTKKLYDLEVEAEAKRKKEEAEFAAYKESVISTLNKAYNVEELTLGNSNLESEDAAYMYGKLSVALAKVKGSVKETIEHRQTDFINMAAPLSGSKEVSCRYVLYLRKQDEKNEKAEHEAAIRRSEREKIEAEQEALRLQLEAESRKTDAIVESIKAIANAGKTDSSDVNVTINNSKEDE